MVKTCWIPEKCQTLHCFDARSGTFFDVWRKMWEVGGILVQVGGNNVETGGNLLQSDGITRKFSGIQPQKASCLA